LAVSSVAWTLWALGHLVDLESLGWWAAAMQSASLYAFSVTATATVVAVGTRSWKSALSAALGTLLLAAILSGRVVPNQQPTVPNGHRLAVLVLNLNQGHADPAAVVSLVKSRAIDVATFPELTPVSLRALKAHGMSAELPYAQSVPGTGSGGIGTYARYRSGWDEDLLPPPRPWMPTKLVVPGVGGVRVEGIHAAPPRPKTADVFRRQHLLDDLPDARFKGLPTVVAGDFNATLDNWRLRRLLSRGYRDAAAERGTGLTPTWSALHGIAALTIDHVLVPPGVAVRAVEAVAIRGTDHRALVVHLLLPGQVGEEPREDRS
jgi:endonuclease/exonuclease/phosphatase (EEP) superfamily protein YafD